VLPSPEFGKKGVKGGGAVDLFFPDIGMLSNFMLRKATSKSIMSVSCPGKVL
jgi:hypothetical protein